MTANSVTRNKCARSLVSLILALSCCGTAITHAADETAGEHLAAEPPPDSASASFSNATKPYVVHVGAFGKRAYAMAMANKIKAADIIADQNELSVYRNRGLMIVRLGPYADYSKAMDIMAKLKKLGVESVLGNNPDLPATAPRTNLANMDSRAKLAKNSKPRAQEDSTADARNAQLQQRVLELEQRQVTEPSPTEKDNGASEAQTASADAEADPPAEQKPAGPGEKNVPRSTTVGTNRDDRRPTDQMEVELFGRPLTIGGEYEFSPEYQEDFTLDDTEDDDVGFIDQSLSIEFFYEISDTVSFFIDGTALYSADVYSEDGEHESSRELERGAAWLLFETVFDSDFDIQIGPQYFSEEREWWWDEVLDGISIQYYGDYIEAELGFAEALAVVSTTEEHIDPEDKDVFRILGWAGWEWADRQLFELFFLSQNDHSFTEQEGDIITEALEDDVDANLYWFGLRSSGRLKHKTAGRFYYWLDTGLVRGEETGIDFEDDDPGFIVADEIFTRDVNGWAVDLGLTWQTKLPREPILTVGYAVGSGDSDPDSADDNSFRQTNLQGNNDKFRGVNRFSYYGELLDPELSNLKIWTVSLGVRLMENSSIEILYHKYDQINPVDFMRNASIEEDPFGEDTEIGQEIDIVLGFEEWTHLEMEFIAGFFRAGNAFDTLSGEVATIFILKVDYNF